MGFVQTVITLLCVYAACGLAFACLFVGIGISRIDEDAGGAGAGFRLIIIPGVSALWPFLLLRWLRASGGER